MQHKKKKIISKEKFTRRKKKYVGCSGKRINTRKGDTSAKLIFEDPILFCQFIKGYTSIPVLQDIQPEDIEDVTERFVHMFTEERNSDVIKKVKLKDGDVPFYLISLIEHKSSVYYNTIMQMLRYMVFIWEDYEKEQERLYPGISKTKGFQYPPVLPIIYYTGNANWTAAVELSDRIYLSDILEQYIPNFRCILVQIKDYTNRQLMEKHDELSILMMINKMQKSSDFSRWKKEVDSEYLEKITEGSPEYLLGIMAHMIELLLLGINVPEDEAEEVARQVKERGMAGLFDHFEVYDVQVVRAEARRLGLAEGRAEGRAEGHAEGRAEGHAEGHAEGITEAQKKDSKVLIEMCQEFGLSEDETKKRLLEKMALEEEAVDTYIKEFWKK